MSLRKEHLTWFAVSNCFLFLHISQLHALWFAVVLTGVASFFYQHILSITLTKSFVEWKQWYYIFLFFFSHDGVVFHGEKEKRCDVMRLVPHKYCAVYNLCIYEWLEEGLFIVGLVSFFIPHFELKRILNSRLSRTSQISADPHSHSHTKADSFQWSAHNSS